MANVYGQARVAFNVSTHGDLNMRVFEAMCSRSPLVTDAGLDNGLRDLFEDGKHLCLYRDDEEMIGGINRLLFHRQDRMQITEKGFMEVLAHHTYCHRAEKMLEGL